MIASRGELDPAGIKQIIGDTIFSRLSWLAGRCLSGLDLLAKIADTLGKTTFTSITEQRERNLGTLLVRGVSEKRLKVLLTAAGPPETSMLPNGRSA